MSIQVDSPQLNSIFVLRDPVEVKLDQSESNSKVVTFEQLRSLVLSGQIFRYFGKYELAYLVSHRLEAVYKPFTAATLTRLLARKRAYIRDSQGREIEITLFRLFRFFLEWVSDFLRTPLLLVRIQYQIKSLSAIRENAHLDSKGATIYLRTDLIFGVKAGGSVAHISGVLNQFYNLFGEPLFFTTDEIPLVKKDVRRNFLPIKPEFWSSNELPRIASSDWFFRFIDKALSGSKIGFLYQRYSTGNFTGLRLARKFRVPFVLEYNGSEIWISRNWGKKLRFQKITEEIELLNLKLADLVIVVSETLRSELLNRGIEDQRILVNPNGVDPEFFNPDIDGSPVRKILGLGNETVIGFIGTFGKWHGAEVLAEAFGRLVQESPVPSRNLKLLLIGNGVMLESVQNVIRKWQLQNHVILTGLIPQHQAPRYLAACDILVAPHVRNPDGTDFFGSPTKLFEYMAMGKGIVASRLNQIGDILSHDKTAWMIEPGDPEDLKNGLLQLVQNPAVASRLGQAARNDVLAKYTWREHTRKIVDKLNILCPT